MKGLQQQIVSWLEKREDETIIIGVSGHGAAGKTTFAQQLYARIQGEVNFMNTDPYIISSAVRRYTRIDYTYEGESYYDKMTACHPAAHNIDSLIRDVKMVRAGMDFYTIDTPYLKSELIDAKRNITIVEGMSVAFLDPALFDLRLYFYTDEDTELIRRSGRDVMERGADLQYLKNSHKQRRIQYELFMHPYSKNFDVIIKSIDDEIRVEKQTFDFLQKLNFCPNL